MEPPEEHRQFSFGDEFREKIPPRFTRRHSAPPQSYNLTLDKELLLSSLHMELPVLCCILSRNHDIKTRRSALRHGARWSIPPAMNRSRPGVREMLFPKPQAQPDSRPAQEKRVHTLLAELRRLFDSIPNRRKSNGFCGNWSGCQPTETVHDEKSAQTRNQSAGAVGR